MLAAVPAETALDAVELASTTALSALESATDAAAPAPEAALDAVNDASDAALDPPVFAPALVAALNAVLVFLLKIAIVFSSS